MNRRRPWLRRGLWASGALAGSLLVAYLIMLGLMRRWVARPPALASEPEIVRLVPEQRGDRVYLGRNWLGRREGLPVLYLTGTPFEMGYANGVLTQKLIHRQEDTVLEMLHRVAPYRWTQFLLKFFVVYKNRDLPDHVAAELQMEMFGISRGCPDSHPGDGPVLPPDAELPRRAGHLLHADEQPADPRRAARRSAPGARTRASGHLLAGAELRLGSRAGVRRGPPRDVCEPSDGIPFISLAWAGMVGLRLGHEPRRACASPSTARRRGLPGDAATPTCLVAREVLQHARNLDEAMAIIRRQPGVRVRAVPGGQPAGRPVRGGREDAGAHGRARGRRRFADSSAPTIT